MEAQPTRPDVFHDLRTALLDLAYELREQEAPLVIGGGYGLFLWQMELQRSTTAGNAPRTIIPMEFWPEARSTQDLDVFLGCEVLTNYARFSAMRQALGRLGYAPVETSKYWQFAKQLDQSKTIVIDILTGPVDDYADKVQVDQRRVRPKRIPTKKGGAPLPKVQLHARLTQEAVGIEARMRNCRVEGMLTSGQTFAAMIGLPHPFPYLLMKLTAYDDRKNDEKKGLAAHHALDVYRIVAMLTEDEFGESRDFWSKFLGHAAVARASGIILRDFHEGGLGVQRIREHPLGRSLPSSSASRFIRALQSIAGIIQNGDDPKGNDPVPTVTPDSGPTSIPPRRP
jgi:hypothetical protein